MRVKISNSWMPWAFLLLGLVMLGGCGGSDGGDADETTELTVSLTDAEGDFNQYTVDVTRLSLIKANGAVVETLPNTVRLDFTQYVEVTEFLTTATVPVGLYAKAEITLDYRNAEITVEDAGGNSIPAQALDARGQPLTSITVQMVFNGREGFRLTPGKPAALVLDFDLEASNEVEISGAAATITVNPVLLASTRVETDRERRLRGLLAGVRLDAQTFAVNLRPFRVRHRDFGKLTVTTDADTVFEIDGVTYAQQEGLEVLAGLRGLVPVVTLGTVSFEPRRYLARQVYAGSSVPWGDKDVLKGSVIARSGNTLSVLGATVELDDGRFRFNDDITVLIDANTRVTRQGEVGNGRSIADISVGQRVTVLGTLSDDGTVLDAEGPEGLVRMRYSQVSGLVASVSPLEVDLQHVNRRMVARYDFSGTGVTPAEDADPGQYQVDTGALSLNTLAQMEPVRVRGFPTAFGTAPQDFEARTVIDLSQLPTKMLMAYGAAGSASAVVSLNENGLLLDLVSAAGRHHLKQAGVVTDIASLPGVPLIEPAADGGVYALARGRRVEVYFDWNEYQLAFNRMLADGHQVIFVIASGAYDATGLTLTARRSIARLTE